MNKLYTTITVKEINLESRSVVAYASTIDKDRDGEVILPEAWRKTIQQRDSVPLVWAHDYRIPPIGKAGSFEIDGHGLKFKAEFAATDFGNEIWGLYRDKFLDSFSVGFIPKQATEGQRVGDASRTFTEVELLEVSGVVVPANPYATVERGVMTLAFKSVDSFTKALTETPVAPPTEIITDDTEPATTDEVAELTPEQLAALAQALSALSDVLVDL